MDGFDEPPTSHKDFLEISIEGIKLDQDPGKDYKELLEEKNEEIISFATEVNKF